MLPLNPRRRSRTKIARRRRLRPNAWLLPIFVPAAVLSPDAASPMNNVCVRRTTPRPVDESECLSILPAKISREEISTDLFCLEAKSPANTVAGMTINREDVKLIVIAIAVAAKASSNAPYRGRTSLRFEFLIMPARSMFSQRTNGTRNPLAGAEIVPDCAIEHAADDAGRSRNQAKADRGDPLDSLSSLSSFAG